MGVRRTVGLSAAVLLAGNSIVGQEKLTPGSVALLVQPQGLVNTKRLTEAIADPQPAVRAVAARVSGMLVRGDLVPTLLEALEREQDPVAGAEQIRALLYVRKQEVLPVVRSAAAKLGERTSLVLAEWLARREPVEFASTAAELLKLIPAKNAGELGVLGRVAAVQQPAERDRITRAMASLSSPPTWAAYLGRWSWTDEGSTVVALDAGLSATDSSVRSETVWFALSAFAAGRGLPLDRIAQPPLTVNPNDSAWTAFGLELLSRRMTGKVTRDHAETVRTDAAGKQEHARTAAMLQELTSAERTALRSVIPGLPDPPQQAAQPPAVATPPYAATRMVEAIVPGFFASLLDAAGCKTTSGFQTFGVVRMKYHPDGRPSELGIDASRLDARCAQVLNAVAALTVAASDDPIPPTISADALPWIVMSINKDVVSCVDALVPPAPDVRLSANKGIKPPTKTRNVNPEYPEAMQKAGIQGVVIVEATLSTDGCVRAARVLRSVRPSLDVAAVSAVSGWKFTPTLLNGTPVPVIMTVTVNFSLR